jgi:hypothetical protein
MYEGEGLIYMMGVGTKYASEATPVSSIELILSLKTTMLC